MKCQSLNLLQLSDLALSFFSGPKRRTYNPPSPAIMLFLIHLQFLAPGSSNGDLTLDRRYAFFHRISGCAGRIGFSL